jgi:hypothetical protein
MQQNPFLEANSRSFSQGVLQLTEPEGSLPCSQELATRPYPQLDESSPHTPFLLL